MSSELSFYRRPITVTLVDSVLSPQVHIVDNDTDLYYRIAVEMYRRIVADNEVGKPTVYICPVGPAFQYRRFVWLCRQMPIDLSAVHLFFMDEYLCEDRLIDPEHPLSFRGFVQRELMDPLAGDFGFDASQVVFPDPTDPAAYDRRLEALGGADICIAGVGINGHLAFNEPPVAWDAPTRVVNLSRETITINSNTALGGAWEQIPSRAVTVGMRQIRASRRLSLYLNRPWQRAVVRKLLYGPVTEDFPASCVQTHGAATVTMTADVAAAPEFALR